MIKKLNLMIILLFVLSACTPTTSDSPAAEEAQPEPTTEPTPTTTPVPTATEEIMPTPTEESTMSEIPDDALTFALGDSFALGGGKTAVLTSGDLTLQFAEVLEDSRCPKDVDCFWEGQARILIIAEQSGQDPLELEFNTNLSTDGATDTLPAYGFMVQLEQLNPYPRSVNNPIAFEVYQAQLIVTQP